MAEEMELDPQLKALLEVANLLNSPGDDSGIPDEELRQQFSGAFGYLSSSCSLFLNFVLFEIQLRSCVAASANASANRAYLTMCSCTLCSMPLT